MDNRELNINGAKPKILDIIYNHFISEKNKQRLRKIPPIFLKWFVGFFSGFAVGFLFCYFYTIIFQGTQFDWKIVTGIFAALGAIFVTIITYTEKFMCLALDKARYHIVEMEYKNKNLDKEIISDKLAKDLMPLIDKKVFHSDTIFEMRGKHYAEEKECIAREYRKLLETRVNALMSNSKLNKDQKIKDVIVIFDSGTTIAQVFEQLGKDSYETGSEHWTKNDYVNFYTNSIRGILCLFKYRDQSSRYSEIPFKCNIFPGKILSPYEAIADEETVKSILNLKREGRYVIFVTTGNYLIFNTKENVFIPIARAGFHPDVKAAGFHIANEIHVLAPLGKILMNSLEVYRDENIYGTLSRFNEKLGYSDNAEDESKQSYIIIEPKLLLAQKTKYLTKISQQDIANDSISSWLKKSLLITTSRESEDGKTFWLSKHSSMIRNKLNPDYNPELTKFPNDSHRPLIQYYRFDGLPYSQQLQVKIEIPHDNLRDKKILHEFFSVPKIE